MQALIVTLITFQFFKHENIQQNFNVKFQTTPSDNILIKIFNVANYEKNALISILLMASESGGGKEITIQFCQAIQICHEVISLVFY